MGYLFSFNGRVDRQAYWTSWVVGLVCNALTLTSIWFLIDAQARDDMRGELVEATVAFSLISLVVSISVLSFQIRRWHDLNKSGWWVLVGLVPIIGSLYAFGMQGFVPGADETNSFGPPQRRTRSNLVRQR